jgi:hypothetical protein
MKPRIVVKNGCYQIDFDYRPRILTYMWFYDMIQAYDWCLAMNQRPFSQRQRIFLGSIPG